MILIVGLGNPGREYENTPHNMGRRAVLHWAAAQNFPDFRLEKKFNAQVSENAAGEQKVVAALPETFMNNSGVSVTALAHFYKLQPENIWVAHDDIDIPLGNVRVALGGGSAGHHGIASIVEKLGSADFWRIRIGIAPAEPLIMPLEAYVLQKTAMREEDARSAIARAKDLLSLALEQGMAGAREASD